MTKGWLRRRRRLLTWLAGGLAVLLIATAASGYLVLRHLNGNLTQVNLARLLGKQPAGLSARGENILVIGADSDVDQIDGNVTTGQPDLIMLLHIAADRKSVDLISIPRTSWVSIPACEEADGRLSAPVPGRLGSAFAIASQSEAHEAFGAACVIKVLEKQAGISIGHFIVADLSGFQKMVAALGGVRQCLQAPITDPNSSVRLSAGCHTLTPSQALAYLRGRSGSGDYADLDRISRQQALVESLFAEARQKLLDPVAIYRFIDAATSSLTIDSGLGGITGLYDLEQTLSSADIIHFTLPVYPRSDVVPSDKADVLWTQPQDSEIFTAIQADLPVGASLYG